jgi:hypothetical protein
VGEQGSLTCVQADALKQQRAMGSQVGHLNWDVTPQLVECDERAECPGALVAGCGYQRKGG